MNSSSRWMYIALVGLALLAPGCPPAGTNPGDTGEVLDSNPGGPPDNGGTPSDNPTVGSPAIRGKLTKAAPTASGQSAPAGREVTFNVTAGCEVVAVSNVTQQVYRATVEANGEFEISLPDSEAGNTFVITILGPDGKPLGPVLLGTADGKGLTGLKPAGEVDLGTIEIPANLGTGPIMAGTDAQIPAGDVDSTSQARVDGNGVPVGVNTFGKGEAAEITGAAGSGIDADKDGLVDLFDADDDGNGRVDDLEQNANSWEMPLGSKARANFFTNLKINVSDADVYYHGTQAQIDAALAVQTVITFECMVNPEPGSSLAIAGAHLLSTPAPAYLPQSTIHLTQQLWSASSYAFGALGDRYGVWVVPNAVMQAGDTFTVEVAFNDGTTQQYSRMLNYILKNIPKLVKYGKAGSLQSYSPAGTPALGTDQNPVLFDGTQPLVVEFNPPVDETGAYLEGYTYAFHLFFIDSFGGQIDMNSVSKAATWPTPIPGLDNSQYRINASDPRLASLSADNTYTLEIPVGVLPSQLVMNDTTVKNVAKYKIDITAECPSGNSAICIYFAKQ